MPALSLDSLRAFAVAVLNDDPRAVYKEITAIIAAAHAPLPPTPSYRTVIIFPATAHQQTTQTHITLQQSTCAENHRVLGKALLRFDRFLPTLERAKKAFELAFYLCNSRARPRMRKSFFQKRLAQTARLHCLVQLIVNDFVFTLDRLASRTERDARWSTYLHAAPPSTTT